MKKIELTKEEERTLNYLLTLNKLAENEFFISKNTDNFEMLNNLLEEKLDTINEDVAYRMLNILFKDRITEICPNKEIMILNGMNVDLPKERLGVLLLSIALNDEHFFERTNELATLGFNNYKDTNMLNGYLVGYPEANYYLILDTAERFIGKISDEDTITKKLKEDIINKFLFLYKDLYDELKTKKVNQKNCSILANRCNILKSLYLDTINDFIDILSINPFCQEALKLLELEDNTIEYDKLLVGKIYLDTILEPLTKEGMTKLESIYYSLEINIDLDNHKEALNYIYDSIYNKKENLDKEKELAKSFHNI